MSEWPDGFLWGTGASSTQTEGASPASDWYRWEQDGRVPRSGDGNGFATRYAEDFALYAEHGLTHHRLSLEWARVEPRQQSRPERLPMRDDALVIDASRHEWTCADGLGFGEQSVLDEHVEADQERVAGEC